MRLPLLFYFYLLIEISTAIIGGFRFGSLQRSLKILELLIIISILEVGVQWYLASLHIRNLWTSHFFTLIETTFIFLIFSFWMKQRKNRLILFSFFLAFSIFWVISKFTFEPFSLTDDLTAAISKFLQIIFSTYLLVMVVRDSDIIWTDDPRLWIAAGIIIYSAGSIFMAALFNMMLQISYDNLRLIMSINWILMIFSNLFFVRGFLCKK